MSNPWRTMRTSMVPLTRRAFLILTVFSASFRAGAQRSAASTSQAVSADEFLRLSQRLTGRRNLDAKVGATYLAALLAVAENRGALAQLAREKGSSPAHAALEQTILEWWYTGTYELGGERRLATHTGALMWDAVGVPAPGTCAGAFGAWSRAPRRRA
jgi:hypothetical protein